MLILLAATMLAADPPLPPCRADQIMLSLDGRDGDFNGMSHSGTLLILRNRGPACQIGGLPRIAFLDGRGRAMPIARSVPIGMHPGPAIMPVSMLARGVASTPLRWVSGQVFDPGRCLSPRRLTVAIGDGQVSTRFEGRICGPNGKPAGFDQPPLRKGLKSSG